MRRGGELAGERDFLPAHSRLLPAPTVLLKRLLPEAQLRVAESIGGGAGLMFTVDALGSALDRVSAEATARNPQVVFNLKWLARDPKPSEYFLEHLILQILAEIAAEGVPIGNPGAISWKISYPSAYSMRLYRRFTTHIGEILERLTPGVPHQVVPVPESICAMQYFRARGKGAEGATTIVIDIGGGTSDIAVWQQGKGGSPLAWQSSIRFAGREIVVEPLAEDFARSRRDRTKLSLIELVANVASPMQGDYHSALTGTLKRIERDRVPAETWLNLIGMAINSPHFAQAFGRALAKVAPDNPANRALEASALGFAGLLWFIGRQIHRMMRSHGAAGTNCPLGLAPELTHTVALCLAGRPSQIIRAFTGNLHPAWEDALKQVLITAAGLPSDGTRLPAFEYTDRPKEEVAFGLLSSRPDIDIHQLCDTILGEDVVGPNNSRLAADDFLRSLGADRPPIIAQEPSEMREFLACVGNITTDPRAGEKFLDLAPKAVSPALVQAANEELLIAFQRDHAPVPAGGEDDGFKLADVQDRPTLTMELQPPFFALLHAAMRSMLASGGSQRRG